jgi:hypothetical protein
MNTSAASGRKMVARRSCIKSPVGATLFLDIQFIWAFGSSPIKKKMNIEIILIGCCGLSRPVS